MRRVVPQASPDYDRVASRVARFVVEVDCDGQATREVALDHHGEPVVRAPDSHNFGPLTDSNDVFPLEGCEPVTKDYFDALWARHRNKKGY